MTATPFWCALIALIAGTASAPSVPARNIYLLMGQSNISGRGLLAELTPDERRPDPAIHLYGNDGQWRPAAEPIDDPTGQLDAISLDSNAGVGPGLFFARALRSSGAGEIGLVPCAKGATSVLDWRPHPSRDRLYGSCLARARDASAQGRIAGIIWYQGESDAARSDVAARWAAHAGEMLTRLRADLGSPVLPIAVVSLGDAPDTGPLAGRYPAWGKVRDRQRTLGLHNLVVVSAGGLPRNPDRLHLSTAGQRILGRRLAAAIQRLTTPRTRT